MRVWPSWSGVWISASRLSWLSASPSNRLLLVCGVSLLMLCGVVLPAAGCVVSGYIKVLSEGVGISIKKGYCLVANFAHQVQLHP